MKKKKIHIWQTKITNIAKSTREREKKMFSILVGTKIWIGNSLHGWFRNDIASMTEHIFNVWLRFKKIKENVYKKKSSARNDFQLAND